MLNFFGDCWERNRGLSLIGLGYEVVCEGEKMQVQRQVFEVTERQFLVELPASFVNHRIELIALTLDDEPVVAPKRRRPHSEIAGKGRTLGDLLAPVVDEGDWACLK